MDMLKEGSFKYGGRDAAGDALFPSGECAIIHASSGLRARILKEAKFEWGAAMLPYWPGCARRAQEFHHRRGGLLGHDGTQPETRGRTRPSPSSSGTSAGPRWSPSGIPIPDFCPSPSPAYERVKASGYYQQNPGADIPYLQLTRTQPTENSRGLRLGNMPEIRNIIQEELEKAFQGQQTAQQALDAAVQRGNVVLRAFERANRP